MLDLQNTDDLCYIHTHFDPLRLDDSFYEKLYFGDRRGDDAPPPPPVSPRKRGSSADEMETSKRCCRENSDSSDSNKEFLERYKRRFEYDERHSYELYPGIHLSSKQSSDTGDSCTNSSDQQENASSLFNFHSLAYDQICARCTCVSSIVRNLSFIAGNDLELVKSKTLISLLARLLLLRHGIKSDRQAETVDQEKVSARDVFFDSPCSLRSLE